MMARDDYSDATPNATYRAPDTTSGRYADATPDATYRRPDIAGSQATLNASFAAHPTYANTDSGGGIVSNAAASTGAPASTNNVQPAPVANQPSYKLGDVAGQFGLKDVGGFIARAFTSNPQQFREEYVEPTKAALFGDGGVKVAPSATQPRTPMAGQEDANPDRVSGPVTAAANATSNELPEGITRSGNSYVGSGVAPTPSINHPDVIGDATRARALDAANTETSYVQGQRLANQQQAGVDLQQAKGEARVANFLRNNAADVVLGGVIDRSRAARGYGAAADQANAKLAEAQKQANATGTALASPSGRNYVQEAAANEASRLAGQKAQIEEAEAGQKQQAGQLQLQHQARINDISNQLVNAKDPKTAARLQQSLLTLLGKNEIGRYDVKVVPGGTRIDPNSPGIPIKDPDRVVVYDKYGQEQPHVMETGQGAAPQQQFKEGQTYTDAKGNKAVYRNGKFEEVK